MLATFPVYRITADKLSGQWIGRPAPTGERTTLPDWWRRCPRQPHHWHTMGGHPVDDSTILIEWMEV